MYNNNGMQIDCELENLYVQAQLMEQVRFTLVMVVVTADQQLSFSVNPPRFSSFFLLRFIRLIPLFSNHFAIYYMQSSIE
jgi:hypothetical protein